jgi:hypothetical protein
VAFRALLFLIYSANCLSANVLVWCWFFSAAVFCCQLLTIDPDLLLFICSIDLIQFIVVYVVQVIALYCSFIIGLYFRFYLGYCHPALLLSLFVTFCHFCFSLFITFCCHFLSLSVTFCHFWLSLSVTFCHYVSLFVTFCYFLSLFKALSHHAAADLFMNHNKFDRQQPALWMTMMNVPVVWCVVKCFCVFGRAVLVLLLHWESRSGCSTMFHQQEGPSRMGMCCRRGWGCVAAQEKMDLATWMMGVCCWSGKDGDLLLFRWKCPAVSGEVWYIRWGWGCAADQARMGASSEWFICSKIVTNLYWHICWWGQNITKPKLPGHSQKMLFLHVKCQNSEFLILKMTDWKWR